MFKRFVFGALLMAAAVIFWWKTDVIRIDVVGQPSQTGGFQDEIEQPFFENLARETGLPLSVRYRPLEAVGHKDTYQLPMLKDRTLDLVSLRFLQNSAVEPELMGIDLVGLIPDFKTGREVVRAYAPIIQRALEERFSARLLGIWPRGPQVFFCQRPIARLHDLAGMKVRIGGATLAPLMTAIGAVPVLIPFDETKEALRIGLVDCAITSSASANSAGWPEHTKYSYSLTTQFGLNGYAINLVLWNGLSASQQRIFQQAFDKHIETIWTFAERLHDTSSACNAGGPCENGKAYHLVMVTPTPEDVNTLREIMKTSALVEWKTICNKVDPDCSRHWHDLLDPIISGAPFVSPSASP